VTNPPLAISPLTTVEAARRIGAEPVPNVLPAAAAPDALRAVQELWERFEANLMPPPPKDPDAIERFSYIPLALEPFLKGMALCREVLGLGRHRFLEVGSGIGTKAALAHALGFDAYGLEYHEPYVDVAHRLFPHVNYACGDARDPHLDYDEFDVVYCYRVAVNRDVQGKINRRIADDLHPGALFFSASGSGPYPEWLEHVDGLVWRKADGA
jgi:SAM-dependent methyltransferase